jgi:hypothetical protein
MEQPKTGNAPGPPHTRVPLDGNKAKAWRWVAGISLSIVIVLLAWSWWVVASLDSSDSQAEQNGAGFGVLVIAVFVLFPAVAVLAVGLINVAATTRSKTERIAAEETCAQAKDKG